MKFLISIVAHNKLDLTRRCVESVLAAMRNMDRAVITAKCRLVLQDNSSTDGTREYFASVEGESKVHVVNYDTNTGFQIPTEAAFVVAREMSCDYLVTVNNDAVVPPNFLSLMFAEFERLPNTAIVGCKWTCCSIGDNMHGYDGGALEYVELSCAMIDVRKVAKHYDRLFDSALHFAYSEDVHLSLKMRKLGYGIRQANFTIEHARGSTSSMVPMAQIAQAENHAWMKVRWAHYLKHRRFDHRIVIRRWAALGDVLLVTAILPELWRTNPLSEIVVETCAPEIFDDNPHVRFAARSIGRRPDDQVIDLDMVSENGVMRHFVASYARACGIEVEWPYETEINFGKEHYDRFHAPEMNWSGRWVALHTGPSTWKAKEWPAAKWEELMSALAADGWGIVTVGSGLLSGLTAFPTAPAKLRDARNATKNVHELAAVISACTLFIGIDSFPLHVAGAVGTPSIGLFGITSSKFVLTAQNAVGIDADPLLWPRAGERHRVAGVTHIEEDGSTIGSLTVAQVLEAVEKLCPAKRGSGQLGERLLREATRALR